MALNLKTWVSTAPPPKDRLVFGHSKPGFLDESIELMKVFVAATKTKHTNNHPPHVSVDGSVPSSVRGRSPLLADRDKSTGNVTLVHSHMFTENSSGLSTQPCGAPV